MDRMLQQLRRDAYANPGDEGLSSQLLAGVEREGGWRERFLELCSLCRAGARHCETELDGWEIWSARRGSRGSEDGPGGALGVLSRRRVASERLSVLGVTRRKLLLQGPGEVQLLDLRGGPNLTCSGSYRFAGMRGDDLLLQRGDRRFELRSGDSGEVLGEFAPRGDAGSARCAGLSGDRLVLFGRSFAGEIPGTLWGIDVGREFGEIAWTTPGPPTHERVVVDSGRLAFARGGALELRDCADARLVRSFPAPERPPLAHLALRLERDRLSWDVIDASLASPPDLAVRVRTRVGTCDQGRCQRETWESEPVEFPYDLRPEVDAEQLQVAGPWLLFKGVEPSGKALTLCMRREDLERTVHWRSGDRPCALGLGRERAWVASEHAGRLLIVTHHLAWGSRIASIEIPGIGQDLALVPAAERLLVIDASDEDGTWITEIG